MLTIRRGERADRLVEALATVLADPLADPFTAEIVAVPTRGVERWLTQRLSTVLGASPHREDGVCANVVFPFPGRLVGASLAAATGLDPDDDPWLPERAVWPLMAVVDEHLDDPWLAMLAAHLGGTDDYRELRRSRRFAVVRHVADLFDRYAVHRPAMVRAWAAGDDNDGHGRALPGDVAWQASLWRYLRERLDAPSPAERLAAACALLGDGAVDLDLPPRLSLFGLTRLPVSSMQVLDAIAVTRDVHLFVLHPSPILWERIGASLPQDSLGLPARRDDPTADLALNPLLDTWGRDAREMQLVIAAGGGPSPRVDIHLAMDTRATTLLGRLQADVRSNRVPPGPPLARQADARPPLDHADHSLQVHACHGRTRQVEVLRDAILHLLADDATLEPRDVIVMCPDIEAFAPLLEASFGGAELDVQRLDGSGSTTGVPDLRFRLADRSLRQTNPVLATVAELLEMADTRLTASQVVDFASQEPVRRRFGLDDDDLARFEDWVSATGIRWGLDAAHRAPYKLDRLEANTWRAGIDRILVGVAMDEDELPLVGGVLPLDDVGSGDIDLVGRLAELVDRLEAAVAELNQPQPLPGWADAIAAATDALTATSDRDAWQRRELDRMIREIVAEATDGDGRPPSTALSLPEIRTLLADRLRGRPTRANFRTGHLTMCTLVPMRSVPHRVVCILGLDDGAFPRRTAPDGDDILEWAPCVGDRDLRSEDRQLLLDALLAATENLVITYSGRDERTNAVLPPAVPLGELLDVVDRTVRMDGPADRDGAPVGSRARDQVVVHHPLQPFDNRNFEAGALVPGRPWSFDRVALDGARASGEERTAVQTFLHEPLAAREPGLVELDDLVAFVQQPVKAFLRQRLGIAVGDVEGEAEDGLPVELDQLHSWGVGDRLLAHGLTGLDLAVCITAERARGVLPPGALGDSVLDDVVPVVAQILTEVRSVVPQDSPSTVVDVSVDLDDGWSVVGAVPGVVGDVVLTTTYSKVGPKQRLGAWVKLLALTAAHPERLFTAVTIGRGNRGGCGVARIPPLGATAAARRQAAVDQLRVLVDLYARGLREPLPIYTRSSAAYAGAPPARREQRARERWETARFEGEDREREHRLVLDGVASFADLLVAVPARDEDGPEWARDETTRFGRYARRLWDGLLAVEERSNL